MNCRIKLSLEFAKELKRLAKRYRSLKTDVKLLGESLKKIRIKVLIWGMDYVK